MSAIFTKILGQRGKIQYGLAALVVAIAMVAASPVDVAAKGKAKITWLGHASLKIVTPSGGVIMVDPWLKAPTNPDKDSLGKLERVDYILITHGHWDHIGNALDIIKKTGAHVIAPYGLGYNLIGVLGFPKENVTVMTGGNVGGTFDLKKAGATVTVVNAVHGSELTPPAIPEPAPGLPRAIASGNPVGYIISIKDGPTIYHTGDTDVFTDMRLIPEFYKVDVMFACIGGHFTMDPARAALAVQYVKPRMVMPIHYGTFGILAGNPAALQAAMSKRKLKTKMVAMKPGDTREF